MWCVVVFWKRLKPEKWVQFDCDFGSVRCFNLIIFLDILTIFFGLLIFRLFFRHFKISAENEGENEPNTPAGGRGGGSVLGARRDGSVENGNRAMISRLNVLFGEPKFVSICTVPDK